MRGIHFRYQQRDFGRHSMILAIADYRIAGAGEVFLGRAGNARIERGKNKIAIERGFQILYDEIRCGWGNGCVEMPIHRFAIFLAEGSFGRGNFPELEPRMIGEYTDEALSDP